MSPRPPLPEMASEDFRSAVEAAPGERPAVSLDDDCWQRLVTHYRMLRRWNRGVGLIGSGTIDDAPARHYAESLAGLAFLPQAGGCLDFGSGAGFPGLILACCRPRQSFVLLEARQRKAAFLQQAVATLGLERCRVAVGRWGRGSTAEQFEAVRAERPFAALTSRAVDLAPWLDSLEPLLVADAVWLAWGRGARPDVTSDAWSLTDEVAFSGDRSLAVFRR